MAAMLAPGSSPKHVGMGPATDSPSNIWQSKLQEWTSIVGMLSLLRKQMSKMSYERISYTVYVRLYLTVTCKEVYCLSHIYYMQSDNLSMNLDICVR